MVTVRLYAAARAAVGAAELSVAPGAIDAALAAYDSPIIARCTFLVNGVAETDRSRVLVNGDRLDVLPPFAGG